MKNLGKFPEEYSLGILAQMYPSSRKGNQNHLFGSCLFKTAPSAKSHILVQAQL